MGYLVLENGKIFKGNLIGSKKNVIGEVVFNTGMTGYEEIITDPSYKGQIVAMTYPLIGNYGVNYEDMESICPQVKGMVVRELCEMPSNWRSQNTLDGYLAEHNITGIQGIDTRDLTKTIREFGTMRGIICDSLPTEQQLTEMRQYAIINPIKEVSVKEKYHVAGSGKKIAVLDVGLKHSILYCLSKRNLDLTVFPEFTTAEEILSGGFDGLMLTNGPGDPKDNADIVENLRKMLGKIPIFGICMGHQLLALAHGGNTVKLKYGHRGSNHPVKDLLTGKMYITCQNHSYAVEETGLPKNSIISFINWNDKTVEGVIYSDKCFSVQFHPEASAGPNDAGFLFDEFVALMDEEKK
ncbi:MAG: carbamoyl phosphate synthase small subunit [Clostridia bacterium]|nr:carbamoyl phosphate synthase small subunit [Clostridia bacterium]